MVNPTDDDIHRSGFVALIGRPNVGKSTLLNAILEQPIAPVSFRPQTTQRRQLGILTLPEAQLIFVDTPGLHEPIHKLGQLMNEYARDALVDVDLVLVVFDGSEEPNREDELVAELVREYAGEFNPLAALNKIDLLPSDKISERLDAYQALLPDVDFILISASGGDGLEQLLERMIAALPGGPQYYPEEEITDLNERDIAADLIRASAMEHLRQELPYVIAVRIDTFKERGESGAYIAATIFVERESQKGIVIGKGGAKLREIGTSARKSIESMSGRKVYLESRVKVLPRWRKNPDVLKRLGYEPVGE